jgi:hypothetical protein
MSCPASNLCVGATNDGKIIGSTEPAGGTTKWKAFVVDGYTAIASLSCAPATTLCAAVDYNGDILATKSPLSGASSWKISRAGATVSLATELLSGVVGGRGAFLATVAVNGGEYAGGPAPLKTLVLTLPAGTVLNTAGHPTCTASVLQQDGPRACPAGSAASPGGAEAGTVYAEASFGGTRVEEVAALELFYSPSGGLLFYIDGHAPLSIEMVGSATLAGNVLTLQLPEYETVPGAPVVSIDEMSFQLGETIVEELAFGSQSPVKLPATCPAGHLALTAEPKLAPVAGLKELTLVGSAVTRCPLAEETPAERKQREKEATELRLHREEQTQTTTTGETSTTTTGEEEAAATKKREAEEAALKKRQAEESVSKKAIEEAAVKRATEEANAKRQTAEAAALKQRQEEVAAKAAAALSAVIVPPAKKSKISTLVKHGAYTFQFTAPGAGVLEIAWYQVPKGAHVSAKAKPVLVATGTAHFSAATTATVTVKLTASGKQLLRHSSQLKITAKGTFAAAGGRAVVTLRTFTLRR